MNRDELLTKLAMELDPADWPIEAVGKQGLAFKPAPEHVIELYGCKAVAFTYEQYLQRRTELINKPGWSEAPEWAEWLAQDADGHWHWYDAKPDAFDRQWDSNHGDRVSRAGPGAIPAGHDWRQTLERRPAFNESRADIIGQNGNDGDHYSARELNPVTSSLTNSQAREIAEVDGMCSDGQPCGHPLTGDDAYCLGCPNEPVDETSTYCDRCGGEYWTPPHEYCPCLNSVSHKPAADSILAAARQHMLDRASTYDKPEGERSMNSTVLAFAAVTGVLMTEEQGWLFMQILKAVRSQQGEYRADNYEDGAAYVALAGEAAARDRGGK